MPAAKLNHYSLASWTSISKKASARLMMPSLTALYSLKLSFTTSVRENYTIHTHTGGIGGRLRVMRGAGSGQTREERGKL